MSDTVTTARVRGIYATALTQFLEDTVDIVEASPPIRTRFDRSFDRGEPAVTIDTTGDRQGVGIHGDAEAVDTVRDCLEGVGLDTLAWAETAPRDAVYVAEVIDTVGGGAIVDLGEHEGYLPFGAADGYVEDDDVWVVQVDRPTPPWSDDRPVLGTELRLRGTVASLVHGVSGTVAGTPDTDRDRELAGITDLLEPDLPAEWGVQWERAASDASMEVLGAALDRQLDRLDPLLEAPTEADGDIDVPRHETAPTSTAWVWFGRSSRMALDETRADVCETMPGHHRIKAGGRDASGAVDFAERLGTDVKRFPVGPVLEQFGPAVDDAVRIGHGKPDGRCYTLGTGTVIDREPADGSLTVEREIRSSGTYDGLEVERASGDVATTRFREGRWWYPTTYRSEDGAVRGTYLNVNTPVELFPDEIRYVDLHVDVLKWPDGEVAVVDADELEAAAEAGHLSRELADHALEVAENVAAAVRE